MNAALFDQLDAALANEGPTAAIDRLCQKLRDEKQFHSLFYALLMQKRQQLGVLPIPTGPASDLPPAVHAEYEEAIRNAAREVGTSFLADGSIPQAYAYFRMIEEIEPIRAALESFQVSEDEDLQPLVQIAFYEGVHPTLGFDWILNRFGLCSAITTVGGADMPHLEPHRNHFIRALIRALYSELRARLTSEIEARFGIAPTGADAPEDTPGVISKLMVDRDWLFSEDAYHIDTSHLSSVVQMAMTLDPCPELDMARELCEYGAKLTGRFLGQEEPPFDKGYSDYGAYLAILAGDNVEENLAHFRRKADEADPEEVGTYPAEVLVNLLVRLGRGKEALAVACKHLAQTGGRQLTCPGINELCQRFEDYDTLAKVSRDQGDPVHYLAGQLAARR